MKRDILQGNKAKALAEVIARELKTAGHIVTETIKGEFCTNATFETVQDTAYALAHGKPQYSTANLHIYES